MDIVDELVYCGKIIERYADPRLKPLSEDNFNTLDRAHQKIRALRNQLAECQWISVEDRLPEYDTYVLVFNGYQIVAEYLRNEFFRSQDNCVYGVTHWKLLPAPLKAISEKVLDNTVAPVTM